MVTKPILYSIDAFDATQASTFKFYSTGGNQVVKNQLTIRNNTTNVVVYQQSVESFKFEHTVPANSLTNNTYYNAYVTTYDASGTASTPSDPIQFWCYTQPTIVFTNIPATNIINASSFSFEFTYNQIEGELLNYYNVILYSSNHVELLNSGEIYGGQSITPPVEQSYLVSGLEDKGTYYIEVKGYTIQGTYVTTGQILFTVTYSSPAVFGVLGLTNDCANGYITGESIISIIEGKSNPEEPIYIDNADGKEVDLTTDGTWVKWTDGYQVRGDFTVQWWFRDMNTDTVISYFMNSSGQKITFTYRNGYYRDETTLKAYVDMTVDTGVEEDIYYRYSEYIDIPEVTDYLTLWVRRIGNVYDIKLANLGSTIPQDDTTETEVASDTTSDTTVNDEAVTEETTLS